MRPARILAVALIGTVAAQAPALAWYGGKGTAPPGTTTQVLLGGTMTSVANSTDRHWPLASYIPAQPSAIQSGVFPFPGKITALKFNYGITLTGAMTYAPTIWINGVATAATCTVTASSSGMICDWTGNVSFNAGDYVEMVGHPTNVPTTATVSHSVVIQPTTANNTVLMSGASTAAFGTTTGTPTGTPIGSNNTPAAITPTSRRHGTVPDGGTIDRLYVATNAPGPGDALDQYVFAVLKNGSATSMPNCTDAGTATSCSDTATSAVSVSGPPNSTTAGDDIEFQGTPTNHSGSMTASNGGFGLRYIPSTAGHYALISTTGTPLATAATQYLPISLSSGTNPTTEAGGVTFAQTFKRMAAKVQTAPGTGNSWTVTLRKNGADTSDTCTIADTATACSITATVAVSDNDKIDIAVVPTGTPTGAQLGVSYLATR